MIGSILGILFDNDPSVIAEGLGIAPYYFVKIPVKAGKGTKTGLQGNIQYTGFRTCQKPAGLLDSYRPKILQGCLAEAFLKIQEELPLGKAAQTGQMRRIEIGGIFGIQKRNGRKQLRQHGNGSPERRTVHVLSVKQNKKCFHHTADRLPVMLLFLLQFLYDHADKLYLFRKKRGRQYFGKIRILVPGKLPGKTVWIEGRQQLFRVKKQIDTGNIRIPGRSWEKGTMGEKRRKKTDISRRQGKYLVLQIPRHSSFSTKGYLNAIVKMNKINLRRSDFSFHQKDGELLRKLIFSVCDGEVFITGCHS